VMGMFPLGPEGSPEPDIIGTAGADQARPRRRRYVVAGGVLAVAGIIAATFLSPPGRHAAASRPGGVAASPAVLPGWLRVPAGRHAGCLRGREQRQPGSLSRADAAVAPEEARGVAGHRIDR